MRCPNGSQLIYCSRPLLITHFIVRLELQHAYYYYNILYYLLVYAQLFILPWSSRACIVSLVRSAPAADDLLLRSPCPFYDCSSFSAARTYVVNKENRRRLLYLMCRHIYILPDSINDIHRPAFTCVCDSSANTESLNDFCWFCLLPKMEMTFLVISFL